MSADVHTGPIATVEETRPTSERTEIATRDTRLERGEHDRSPMLRHVGPGGVAATPSPIELIQFALERGVVGDQLKDLVALHNQQEDRNAVKAFNTALAEFQRACPPLQKNRTAKIPTKGGGAYSFKYAEFDVIEAHVRPYLQAQSLWYTFDGSTDEKGIMFTGVCILSHAAGHSRQSKFTLQIANDSAMSNQQKVSAAYSFAKRQALAAVLGLNITDKEVPDDEIDPTTITDDQVTQIDDLMNETRADRARFLKLFDAKTVADIRAADYARAVALLEEKKSRMRT